MEKQKKKILIVEDESLLLDALTDKFAREGFEVLQAHNGQECLSIALEKHPDIILLDIVMPKMDGMTALKKLRAHDAWGRTVPVVLLTNLNIDDKLNQDIVETEPAYYLVKSDWEIGQVAEKVKERLGMVTPLE